MSQSSAPTTTPGTWPEGTELKEYSGGCHCSKFRFHFTHPPFENGEAKVMSCNCTICSQHGLLHIYVPESQFEFTAGQPEQLSSYQLLGKLTKHQFCPSCGSNIILRNEEEREVVVNVRAVDDVDVSKLDCIHFDGRNKL
ncbi:GFA domain-containing protein [Phanerochaete sordida]|uniref:GFA domain-containing protein n=1 Tax=Phanerochaete sordida TaxID=48140 RepID=A0A9P3LDG3_9APHY|nr:GFA domain-containing protein [Phanerochaete sordida]